MLGTAHCIILFFVLLIGAEPCLAKPPKYWKPDFGFAKKASPPKKKKKKPGAPKKVEAPPVVESPPEPPPPEPVVEPEPVPEREAAATETPEPEASPSPEAAEPSADAVLEEADGNILNFTLGVNYIFPSATLFLHVYRSFSLSVGASYYIVPVNRGEFRGYGGQIGLNFFSKPSFQNFWIQAVVGKNTFIAKLAADSEEVQSLSAHLSIGWRWKFEGGLNFGFGVGGSYLFRPKETIDLAVPNLTPVIIMDIGISF